MIRPSLTFHASGLLLWLAGVPAGAVSMDMVTVGQPGNAPDPLTLAGSVAHEYRIAQYDVTIGEYVEFLNAVAKRDPNKLYHPKMATDLQVAGIRRTGKPGHYVYTALVPSGPVQNAAATTPHRPITYVSWFDAARFANWMANGQPTGRQNRKTTEDGA